MREFNREETLQFTFKTKWHDMPFYFHYPVRICMHDIYAHTQSCINVPGQAVVLFAPAHFWKDQHWPALWQCDFQGQIVGFLWLSLMPATTLLLCSALLPMPKKMFAEITSGF